MKVEASATADLPETWRPELIAWAKRTRAVTELWLFGSRAKGTSKATSDVDIAVALAPAIGDHNWALGDYVALSEKTWKPELCAIVGRPISFGAITPGDEMDVEVRSTGKLIWERHPGRDGRRGGDQ
jgi:predicted nucleotidyltransferase